MLGDGGGYGSLMSIKFNVRIKNTDTEQGQWSTVHRYRTSWGKPNYISSFSSSSYSRNVKKKKKPSKSFRVSLSTGGLISQIFLRTSPLLSLQGDSSGVRFHLRQHILETWPTCRKARAANLAGTLLSRHGGNLNDNWIRTGTWTWLTLNSWLTPRNEMNENESEMTGKGASGTIYSVWVIAESDQQWQGWFSGGGHDFSKSSKHNWKQLYNPNVNCKEVNMSWV